MEIIKDMRLTFFFALVLFFSGHLAAYPQYSIIENNHKKGLVNDKGELIIPAIYQNLGWSTGSFSVINNAIGFEENGLWGILSLANKVEQKAAFTHLSPASDQLLIAAKKGRFSNQVFYGLMDTKGKWQVPSQYLRLQPTGNLLIAAYSQKRKVNYGVINHKNQAVIPFQYYLISSPASNYFITTDWENKRELKDFNGKKLLPFDIDNLLLTDQKFGIIYTGGKLGLINQSGKLILEPNYKNLIENEDGTFNALSFSKWRMLDSNDKEKGHLFADEAGVIARNIYFKLYNGKTRLVDFKGDSMLIDGRIQAFNEHLLAMKSADIWKLYNWHTKEWVGAQFDSLFFGKCYILGSNGYTTTKQWTLMDTQGIQVAEQKFERVIKGESRFLVKMNRKWGVLDEQFDELLPAIYDSILVNNEDYLVNFKGYWGLLDKKSNWKILPEFISLHLIDNGVYLGVNRQLSNQLLTADSLIYESPHYMQVVGKRLIVEKDHEERIRLINDRGEALTAYEKAKHLKFGELMIVFQTNNAFKILAPELGWNFELDLTHEILAPPTEGYLMIKKDGKVGFVDGKGKLRIANRYEDASNFENGLAAVKIANKWAFIDQQEQLVIQPYYIEVGNFVKGKAIVKRAEDDVLVIDTTGKSIIEGSFTAIARNTTGNYLLKVDNQFGLADPNGKMLIYPKYEIIVEDENKFVRVKRNGKYGLVTSTGINTIPIIYDALIYDKINEVYFAKEEASYELLYKSDLKVK